MKIKRKRKGGRPRNKNAERYPGGQIKHQYRKEETEKQAMATVMEMRQKIHKISGADVKSPLAGFVLGRMLLDKSINQVLFDAGQRYAQDMVRYYRLTGIPAPSPRAQDLFAVKGYTGDVRNQDSARQASNDAMRLESILLTQPNGTQIKTTVYNVCVMDYDNLRDMPPHMFGWLRCGLQSLAVHYGLQDTRKSANKTISSAQVAI